MRSVLTAAVRLYQRTVSGAFGRRCRYYPTCSEYARLAIRDYGALRGSILAGWRLLRCNPFTPGGVDHPHEQRIFAAERAS